MTSTAAKPVVTFHTLADVIAAAYGVPPDRIVYHPPPGEATEEALLERLRQDKPCELVNGIFIKKPAWALMDVLNRRSLIGPRRRGGKPYTAADYETVADVIAAAGGVPPEQILWDPLPGTATEADVVAYDRRGVSLELVNGILVRKVMGFRDDRIAAWMLFLITQYVVENDLGEVGGAQAMLRLAPGVVRMPDVCYTPRESPADEGNEGSCQLTTPTLVVEVLSPSNTKGDMASKLTEYAAAGVKLVWYVDPQRQEVDVYSAGRAKSKKTFTVADTHVRRQGAAGVHAAGGEDFRAPPAR